MARTRRIRSVWRTPRGEDLFAQWKAGAISAEAAATAAGASLHSLRQADAWRRPDRAAPRQAAGGATAHHTRARHSRARGIPDTGALLAALVGDTVTAKVRTFIQGLREEILRERARAERAESRARQAEAERDALRRSVEERARRTAGVVSGDGRT